jgi:hypothetical protein
MALDLLGLHKPRGRLAFLGGPSFGLSFRSHPKAAKQAVKQTNIFVNENSLID